jgi:pyruvate kinase
MIELFDAGMALARFNLAHGNLKVSHKLCIYLLISLDKSTSAKEILGG